MKIGVCDVLIAIVPQDVEWQILHQRSLDAIVRGLSDCYQAFHRFAPISVNGLLQAEAPPCSLVEGHPALDWRTHVIPAAVIPAAPRLRFYARPFTMPHAVWPTHGQGIGEDATEAQAAVNDERSLISRLGRGDREAFATLYDRHAALVYGICNRILRNPAQAEDVTQSVFTTLWAKPQSFNGGNFAGWLSRVARNAALDIVRSAASRTREPELPEDLVADTNLEDIVFSRLRSSAVVEALRELPDDQRDAIERAYFEGLSYREVAESIGAPLGTVKSRIRSGLRRLWESLQRQVIA